MRGISGFLPVLLAWVWMAPGARAEPLPAWVLNRPASTAKYKFYVGRSSPKSVERDALREAMNDSAEQANKENFGFFTKTETESFETLTDVKLSKRNTEQSQEVRLVSFEQVNLLYAKVQAKEGELSIAYVLYRYPLAEIEQEKRRLRKILADRNETPVHEIGEGGGRRQGGVEIRTDPPGAEVKVDHRSWGKTPVRILGGLEPGEHLIDLIHPDYEPEINGSLLIVPHQIVQYKKTLQRREVELEIKSEPDEALVSLNGKTLEGSTPLKFKALLGDSLGITITHPETHPQTTSVVVGDGMELPVFKLAYKPARVLLDSIPEGAQVFIDGKEAGKTGDPRPLLTTMGKHSIELKKSGFVEEEINVELKGGESRVVPTVKLVSISIEEQKRKEREAREKAQEESDRKALQEWKQREKEREEREEREEEEREDARIALEYPDIFYFYELGASGSSSEIPYLSKKSNEAFCCLTNGLGIQKRLHRKYYLRGQYSLGLGKDFLPDQYGYDDYDSKEIIVAHDLGVGIVWYFGTSARIIPEVGALFTSRHSAQGDFSQTYFGVNLGTDQITTSGPSLGMSLKIRHYSKAGQYNGGVYVSGGFSFGAQVRE